jgi:hypothetical protein
MINQPYLRKPIRHARAINVPPYQWTAIDIKTRLRFLSYSYEKSFSNGLSFMLTIIYFLRILGITHRIYPSDRQWRGVWG